MRKTKLLLSAAVLMAASSFTSVRAQFSSDPNVNALVDTAGLSSPQSRIATGPDGKSFVVWLQANKMRMQLIDSNGVKQWNSGGVVVDTMISTAYADQLIVDKEGNAIYTVTDQRNPGLYKNRAILYKIDQQGNSLWGANGGGIVLYDTTNTPYYSFANSVCVTDSNNIVVSYQSVGTTKQFMTFEKYSPAGVMMWDTKKRIIDMPGNPQIDRSKLISTGGETFILMSIWKIGNYGTPTPYAQKYDGAGNGLWAAPVRVSNKGMKPGTAYSSLSTDGYGGALVTFSSGSPISSSITESYAQRIYADGHLWDTTGRQLVIGTGTTTQRFENGCLYAPAVNSYFACMRQQVTSDIISIVVQKLDTAGNVLFGGLSGVEVVPQSAVAANAPYPAGFKLMDSGVVVVYTTGEDASSSGATKIAAKKMGFSGSNLWSVNPVAISTANSKKGSVTVGDYLHNQVVVSWNDARLSSTAPLGPNSNGAVYVQNLRMDSVLGVVCPTVTMDSIPVITIGDSAVTLTQGHPTGGVYSGTGVTNGVFDPAISGPGTFTITYVRSANPCLDSASTTVTVKCPAVAMDPLPSVSRDGGPVTLTGGHPAGGTYSGIGVTNGVFNPLEAGADTFTITYTYDVPPCRDSASTTIIVIQPAGIHDVAAQDLFECYPNPASGQFVLTLKQKVAGNVTVKVTGVDGREVLSDTRYSNGKYSHSFDISGVAGGIYIVEVKTPSGSASAKLIKQ